MTAYLVFLIIFAIVFVSGVGIGRWSKQLECANALDKRDADHAVAMKAALIAAKHEAVAAERFASGSQRRHIT